MNKFYKVVLFTIIVGLSFSSCKKEETFDTLKVIASVEKVLSYQEASDGVLTAKVEGGKEPYFYEWINSSGIVVGTESLVEDLPGGEYDVTVKDSNGEIAQDKIVLSEVSVKTLILNYPYGADNGKLQIEAVGIKEPYSIQWRDATGATIGKDEVLSNLGSGIYTSIVIDEEGNLYSSSVKLENAKYKYGYIVTNEGTFTAGNSSVSFIDAEGKVEQGIFKSVNRRDLGDVLQSVTIIDDKAYLVVNNSNKVEIVDANTFEVKGVISDLQSPRYLLEEDGKLYISQWGNSSVGIYSKTTLQLMETLPVGNGPEGLIDVNDEIWVANSGGWTSDNTISIINTKDNSVISLPLGADNPKKMVEDSEGDIWVICAGKVVYNADYSIKEQTPSKLIEIDASSKKIKRTIELSKTVHYGSIDINDSENVIYYGGGYGTDGIFKISTSDNTAPTSALISGSFYGFGVDENDNIYGAVAPDFTSPGYVVKYDSTGKEVAKYDTGIGPNGVVFND